MDKARKVEMIDEMMMSPVWAERKMKLGCYECDYYYFDDDHYECIGPGRFTAVEGAVDGE